MARGRSGRKNSTRVVPCNGFRWFRVNALSMTDLLRAFEKQDPYQADM
jgi:hypothetical protein